MARWFSKKFYASKEWIRCRKGYIAEVHGLCEICEEAGLIVHHKITLTSQNINCPEITLNFDNLMLVCLDCHNRLDHEGKQRYVFDKEGNVIPT